MGIRLVLVDGHPIVREGLKALFAEGSGMKVVAEAATAKEALEKSVRLRPDVVLLEPALPEMDGLEVARRLASELPETKVLVLSEEWGTTSARAALEAGASGFLGKECSFAELSEAIRTVAEGRLYLSDAVCAAFESEEGHGSGMASGCPFGADARVHDALLKAVFENTADAVFVKDLEGRYLLMNRAGAAFLGRSVVDVVGHKAAEFFPPAVAAKVERAEGRARAGGVSNYEITFEAGGVNRTLLATLGGYRNGAGEVIGLFGIARDITERKLVESEIASYRRQLRHMASMNARAEAQQRQRIATALHDQIGQSLAFAKMGLEHLESRRPSLEEMPWHEIRRICELLDFSIQQTRSLTLEVSPHLHEVGLKTALASLCADFQKRHGIEVRFQGVKKGQGLPEDVRALVFQGARELLVNVVKHAKASLVETTLDFDDHWVTVRVADNGVGCDSREAGGKASMGGGFGLSSLKKRLHSCGGRLDIRSAPGEGTAVTIALPVTKRESGGP